ncbi:MAG: zinc ribbon domain-containing protein [Methanobrevibacter sp.]|nr:zinc ribbon domain-containing protein [Methanobrevibacter sp.]
MSNKVTFETKRIIGIGAIILTFLIYFLRLSFLSGLEIGGDPSILLMIVGVLLIIQNEKINEYNKILGCILIAASLIMNLPGPIGYCLNYGYASLNAPAILISIFGNLYLIFCAIIFMISSKTIVKKDRVLYCPECGKKLDNDVQFCSKCGNKIK